MTNPQHSHSGPHWVVLGVSVLTIVSLLILLSLSGDSLAASEQSAASSRQLTVQSGQIKLPLAKPVVQPGQTTTRPKPGTTLTTGEKGVAIIDPATKRPLPLEECGTKCQIFDSQNKIIRSITAEIVETERTNSPATCCITLMESTRVSGGVATQSTLQYCCTFPNKNQCVAGWYGDPSYTGGQCTTEWK